MQYVLKLWSEITIKSDGVRKLCIKILKRNISIYFDEVNIEHHISGNWDRIFLEVSDIEDQDQVQKILTHISGIESFSVVESFVISELPHLSAEEASQKIYETLDSHFDTIFLQQKASFVVRVRRSGNHHFSSIDIEWNIWAKLLKKFSDISVNLDTPDITIHLEIKDTTLYVLWKKYQAMSGYPTRFQGKVISLISGGFDSGVATYMMANRGCMIDFVFFNLWWNAHELGVQYISQYLWKTFSLPYSQARFISIPFEEIITTLLKQVEGKYRAIILKRCMLKVADMIRKNGWYTWIVTGESIGQVSSQTLQNLSTIDAVSKSMILRPLISMNKQDIITISKTIGTFDFSSAMPEYCGIVSDKPSIGATVEEIQDAESTLFDDILLQAFTQKTLYKVSDMLCTSSPQDIPEISKISDDIQVIDIREPQKIQTSPLYQKGVTDILEIPFYEINHTFPKLDQAQQYALYCDSWVLSHLHGLYLRDRWFTNIQVFRA